MTKLYLIAACTLLTACAAESQAQLVFSFEGGATANGFTLLQESGSTTTWVSSNEVIDAGDGFNVLSATHGADRVVVAPYFHRDNHDPIGAVRGAQNVETNAGVDDFVRRNPRRRAARLL